MVQKCYHHYFVVFCCFLLLIVIIIFVIGGQRRWAYASLAACHCMLFYVCCMLDTLQIILSLSLSLSLSHHFFNFLLFSMCHYAVNW